MTPPHCSFILPPRYRAAPLLFFFSKALLVPRALFGHRRRRRAAAPAPPRLSARVNRRPRARHFRFRKPQRRRGVKRRALFPLTFSLNKRASSPFDISRNGHPFRQATLARLQWLGCSVIPLNELVLSQRIAKAIPLSFAPLNNGVFCYFIITE